MTIQSSLRYAGGHGTGQHSAHEKHSRASRFGFQNMFVSKSGKATQVTFKSPQVPARVSDFRVHADDDIENVLPRNHLVDRLTRSDSISSVRSCESTLVRTHSQRQAYKHYFRTYTVRASLQGLSSRHSTTKSSAAMLMRVTRDTSQKSPMGQT